MGETDGCKVGRPPQRHGEHAGNDQRVETERSRTRMEEVPEVIGVIVRDLRQNSKCSIDRSSPPRSSPRSRQWTTIEIWATVPRYKSLLQWIFRRPRQCKHVSELTNHQGYSKAKSRQCQRETRVRALRGARQWERRACGWEASQSNFSGREHRPS